MVEQRLNDSVRAKPPYRISRRGKKAAATEFTVYAAAFADAQKDLYDKGRWYCFISSPCYGMWMSDKNPKGFIPMCMAENRTMGGDVEKKFRKVRQTVLDRRCLLSISSCIVSGLFVCRESSCVQLMVFLLLLACVFLF